MSAAWPATPSRCGAGRARLTREWLVLGTVSKGSAVIKRGPCENRRNALVGCLCLLNLQYNAWFLGTGRFGPARPRDASHLEGLRLAARSNVPSLVAAYSHPQLQRITCSLRAALESTRRVEASYTACRMWDAYGSALVPHQSSNLAAFDRTGLSPGPDASGLFYRPLGRGDAHGPRPLRPNACNPMLADARDPMQYSL